jgi:5-(carboxyamino)imidazole ribonucleotide mutase
MDGLDSLLSMVQMPQGIPVATVAVNGSDNAALLALQFLSLEDKNIENKLEQHRIKMAQDVLMADAQVREEN